MSPLRSLPMTTQWREAGPAHSTVSVGSCSLTLSPGHSKSEGEAVTEVKASAQP